MRGSFRYCGPEALGCGFGFALLALRQFWSWSQDVPENGLVSGPAEASRSFRTLDQPLAASAAVASGALADRASDQLLPAELQTPAPDPVTPELPPPETDEPRPPAPEDRFLKKYNCIDEPGILSMLKQIEANQVDLKSTVETAYNDPGAGLKFEIKQNKVTMSHNSEDVPWWGVHELRGKDIEKMVDELLHEADLPDMVFAVQPGDGAGTGKLGSGSGLMVTEGKKDKDLMWLPRSLMDWGRDARKGLLNPKCKMAKQKEQAIFRGSPTGGCHTWDTEKGVLMIDGKVLPRYALVKLSKDKPALVNARFSSAPDDCFPSELTSKGMVATGKLDDQAQSCYAAIVVPYGNSVADRLARQLALGVPIIMMRGRDDVDEFWYDEVVNGTHWLEATTDSLPAVLRHITSHKKLRDTIGDGGRRFVEERLSEKRLKCYVYTLLKEYGNLYKKLYPDR